jgi:hypothetical protein
LCAVPHEGSLRAGNRIGRVPGPTATPTPAG